MANYKIASAIRQGVSHQKTNTPCEDAIKIVQKNNFIFMGIADGAGSELYAKEAAEFILSRLALELEDKINYYLISSKVQAELTIKIESILRTYSVVYNIDYSQLASTLLFVCVSKNRYLLGHIGDGIIAHVDIDNNLSVLSEPVNFEYDNVTVFCNSNQYTNRLRLSCGNMEDIQNGVILASDGVQDTLYHADDNKMANICNTFINWLDLYNENEVSDGLDYNLKNKISKLNGDDLSIIIAKVVKNETV